MDLGSATSDSVHKLLKKIFPLAIAVSLAFIGTAIPAYAADNTLKVSNPPAEFIIGTPGDPDPELTVTVIVSGPVAAEINLEFVDYIFDEAGSKTRLPPNSTPHSLAKVFRVKPFDRVYKPSASGSEYVIALTPKQKKIDQIYYGGIKVNMVPTGSSSQKGAGSASQTGAIVSQVNVTPFGFAGDIKNGKITAAQLTKVSFTSTNRTSIIDSLIPDLPGLVNSGPIEAQVRYQNGSEYPVFAYASWEFLSDEKVLAKKSSNKTILLGGKSATRSVITQSGIEGTQAYANVLPDFGTVKIKTTVASELGGTKFDPVVQESMVLIVQWKEPFFFTLLIGFVIWYVSRRRPSKEGQKRKEPSLAWLAIKALSKYLKKRFAKPSKPAN
jgi:hypothetical protein